MTRSCRLLPADSHALAVWLLGICADSASVAATAPSSAAARSTVLVIIGDHGTGGNVVDSVSMHDAVFRGIGAGLDPRSILIGRFDSYK